MARSITWPQALAWRLKRHLLDPVGTESVADVVRRLSGVQAQVASYAELAIRLRRRESKPGEMGQALAKGTLIKTWAMRGALHVLTPRQAGDLLSLMASGRSWERPSWQRHFGVSPRQIEELRRVARRALDGNVLTREQLVAAVEAHPDLAHAGAALRSGWGTLLKPLAWQGDLCFGPSRGNQVTFMLPEAASPTWRGVPDPEEAAPRVITAYLGAYGPTTPEAFGNWLSGGWFGKKRLRGWFADLGTGLTTVDVEGEEAYVLASDLDDLKSTRPSTSVRLLPGFDQFVLGPGTADGHVVPTARRAAVSRQSGWISPVVVVGGVVGGTWDLNKDQLRVAWFGDGGPPPQAALKTEVRRLSIILGHQVELVI